MSEFYLPPIFLRSPQETPGVRTIDITLGDALYLPQEMDCYIAVHTATIPYSFITISAAKKNNLIRISNDGGSTWDNLILPDGGYYSALYFQTALETAMDSLGYSKTVGGVKVYPIRLSVNLALQRIVLILDSANLGTGTQIAIDLNQNAVASTTNGEGIAQELGFVPLNDNTQPYIQTTDGEFLAGFEPQISELFTSGVDVLLEGDVEGKAIDLANTYSNKIARVNLSSTSIPGDVLTYPQGGQVLVWVPLVRGLSLSKFQVRFVRSDSQTNEDLIFSAGNAACTLLIKAVKPMF